MRRIGYYMDIQIEPTRILRSNILFQIHPNTNPNTFVQESINFVPQRIIEYLPLRTSDSRSIYRHNLLMFCVVPSP